MTTGWGVSDEFAEGDESAPSGSLGDGHFLRIDEDVWRGLMHRPEVVAAITARANAIAAQANALAEDAMDPRAVARLRPADGQTYKVSVQNDPHASRARARVQPNPDAPMLGILADAHDSTLLKSVEAQGGSDPIPTAVDLGIEEPEAAPGRMTGIGFDEVE